MLGRGLSYVGVVVRDVPAVAEILERDFELPRANCQVGDTSQQAPVFPVGETALALFELGDPFVRGAEKTGLHHIAVTVDSLEEAVRDAAEIGLPALSAEPEPVLGGSRRVLLDPSATCGTITYLSEPLSLPVQATPDAEVERIDHLGVASADNVEVTEVFARRMGWPVESTQTDVEISTKTEAFTSDKYGVVYRNHQPEFIGGLRVSFITVGDLELEFLQNVDPRTLGIVDYGHSGSTRQDQGAISRYIESRGPGLHHTGFKVKDINGLLSRLEKSGLTVIDHEGRPGGRRSLIGSTPRVSAGGWCTWFSGTNSGNSRSGCSRRRWLLALASRLEAVTWDPNRWLRPGLRLCGISPQLPFFP